MFIPSNNRIVAAPIPSQQLTRDSNQLSNLQKFITNAVNNIQCNNICLNKSETETLSKIIIQFDIINTQITQFGIPNCETLNSRELVNLGIPFIYHQYTFMIEDKKIIAKNKNGDILISVEFEKLDSLIQNTQIKHVLTQYVNESEDQFIRNYIDVIYIDNNNNLGKIAAYENIFPLTISATTLGLTNYLKEQIRSCIGSYRQDEFNLFCNLILIPDTRQTIDGKITLIENILNINNCNAVIKLHVLSILQRLFLNNNINKKLEISNNIITYLNKHNISPKDFNLSPTINDLTSIVLNEEHCINTRMLALSQLMSSKHFTDTNQKYLLNQLAEQFTTQHTLDINKTTNKVILLSIILESPCNKNADISKNKEFTHAQQQLLNNIRVLDTLPANYKLEVYIILFRRSKNNELLPIQADLEQILTENTIELKVQQEKIAKTFLNSSDAELQRKGGMWLLENGSDKNKLFAAKIMLAKHLPTDPKDNITVEYISNIYHCLLNNNIADSKILLRDCANALLTQNVNPVLKNKCIESLCVNSTLGIKADEILTNNNIQIVENLLANTNTTPQTKKNIAKIFFNSTNLTLQLRGALELSEDYEGLKSPLIVADFIRNHKNATEQNKQAATKYIFAHSNGYTKIDAAISLFKNPLTTSDDKKHAFQTLNRLIFNNKSHEFNELKNELVKHVSTFTPDQLRQDPDMAFYQIRVFKEFPKRQETAAKILLTEMNKKNTTDGTRLAIAKLLFRSEIYKYTKLGGEYILNYTVTNSQTQAAMSNNEDCKEIAYVNVIIQDMLDHKESSDIDKLNFKRFHLLIPSKYISYDNSDQTDTPTDRKESRSKKEEKLDNYLFQLAQEIIKSNLELEKKFEAYQHIHQFARDESKLKTEALNMLRSHFSNKVTIYT
ncbi:MAG: hypothetical protein QG673_990 [Pseudomonadota bacterium]|nr:hypothetical protein [Pseudomonadota bacterium]